MEDCLCRDSNLHTHFIDKARHGSAPTSQRAHQGTSRWSTRRGLPVPECRLSVSGSTLPTTEQQSCPHTDRAKSYSPAKHALFLLLPQELCFCCALCLEGLSLSDQGLFPQNASPDPCIQTVTWALLLHLCGFIFSPWNLILSFHYDACLFYFSSPCKASSMRSDCQGQGFNLQSHGHLGQSLCEVLQNKRVHLSTVWWLLSCKGMLFWLNLGQNFPIYPC